MNTKVIGDNAISVIDQYRNFHIGNAVCSVPYFNNRRGGLRGGLRGEVGKGSSKDIFEEVMDIIIKDKIDKELFNNDSLKGFLVDNNIGVDCSAFAYYVLNEESKSKGKGNLDRHLSFPFCNGFFGKIKCSMRPVENADVQTFAHAENSKVIILKDIQVGDIITMTGGGEDGERDHILVVNQIEYQNFVPITIHYVHAVAWPTDGEYGHGIHEGKIEILDIVKGIVEQRWIENGKIGAENYTFARALKSVTEIRRLNWF